MPAISSAPSGSAPPHTRLTYVLAILACLLICVMAMNRLVLKPSDIQLDSPRYAISGLNLLHYGTLNLNAYDPHKAPEPEMSTGGLLTAVEMALAVALHEGTRQTLICIANERGHAATRCTGSLLSVKALYALALGIFFFALWHLARLVLQDAAKAWLALILALCFREVFLYASSILSEPLFLCVSTLFLWAWAAAWLRRDNLLLWFVAGVLLGLTTFVKPVWNGLAPLLLLALAWQGWRDRPARKQWWGGGLLLLAGIAITLGPMLARNIIQLGLWGLSDPFYFGQSMAHRMGYNKMTWFQWLTGWAIYFTDFGDNLVKIVAGQEFIKPFGWEEGGFYRYGVTVLHYEVIAKVGREAVGHYFIIHEILGNPLKNAAVTLLLLWRGIFVGRIFAFLALAAAVPVLRYLMNPRQRMAWLLIFLPALWVATLNAQVSVSIVRYNIALIPAFAIILAAVFAWMVARVAQSRYAAGLLATANRFLPKKRRNSRSSSRLSGKTARSYNVSAHMSIVPSLSLIQR